jgi:hypothetical protein
MQLADGPANDSVAGSREFIARFTPAAPCAAEKEQEKRGGGGGTAQVILPLPSSWLRAGLDNFQSSAIVSIREKRPEELHLGAACRRFVPRTSST